MTRRRLALYAAAAGARARAIAARGDGVTILLYHRVAEPGEDPQRLAVSPDRFASQLSHVREHCTPIRLAEVPALLRSRRLPRRPVAITFDDGYRDNLERAKPLLERHGVPATVFVTSGYVGSGREFWWDELERLLLVEPVGVRAPDVAVPGGGRLAVADVAERSAAYACLHERLRRSSPAGIDAALVALRAWACEPPAGRPRPDRLAVDRDELVRLDGGVVEIGAHTRTHVSLAARPAAVQREEIAGSTVDLADWLGRPVTAFSYPFGTPGMDVAWRTRRLARAAGHELAVVNWPRRAVALDSRYALPRHIVRDWPADRFARWLDGEALAA